MGAAEQRDAPDEAGARDDALQVIPVLDVWLRHLKIFADLLGEIVVDFVVARDAGGFPGGAIHVNRVVAALTQQLTALFFEMSNQVSALHALTFSGSRITSGPDASS